MTDFREATPGGATRHTDDIESDIRRTRDRMGDEMEAIGDKFRPERIKQRAREAVSRKGASLWRTAKENPVPTAIVALGLTLLFKARAKQRDSGNGYASEQWGGPGESTQGVKAKAQEVASAAGEKVQHVAEQATEKVKRTGMTLEEFFERNPLIAGAGALVLGAAVGALIPETEKENRIMGHSRDELVGQVKDVARQAQGAIGQKLSEHPSGTQSQR